MNYRCMQCGSAFAVPQAGEGEFACPSCAFSYRYGKNYLRYDSDRLLFDRFKEEYLLYKALSNNAYLAYLWIQEGSLSVSEREEVTHFRKYIQSHTDGGKLLDIGCGILERPGYLDFPEKERFEFYGIDPIDDRSFCGMRVTGCAEFMPFPDGFFDALIFATSLDHVCSLRQTIRESHRVLRQGGKCIVWMSDPVLPWRKRLRSTLLEWVHKLRNPSSPWADVYRLAPGTSLRMGRFSIYPNLSVFYMPEGAVDPFHGSYENPRRLNGLMKEENFIHHDEQVHHRNKVFLCFRKGRGPEKER